jgi:hypothetical protein
MEGKMIEEKHVELLNCASRTMRCISNTYFESRDEKRDLERKCIDLITKELNTLHDLICMEDE